jgi:lincosamide nucleotidyltransferase A/C/D/E
MSGETVQVILDQVGKVGIVTWLDGGWGVDALLGRQSRTHADVDLVLDRRDLPRALATLEDIGFCVDSGAVPGLPARLVLSRKAEIVDFHPVVFDGRGNGWQALGDHAWGLYPAEGLRGTGQLKGNPVRCLTAELQVRHHLGYPPSDNDRRDLRALAEVCGVAIPPGW